MLREEEATVVVDRYFYETFRRVQNQKNKVISQWILRALSLMLAIPINHLLLEQERKESISIFTIFLVTALGYNLLEAIFQTYLYCTRFRNRGKVLKIAMDFHHTFLLNQLKSLENEQGDEELHLYQVEEPLDLKISTLYYDFENMEKMGDVSQEFKYLREKNGENIIRSALESDLCGFKAWSSLFHLCSLGIMCFGFAVSSATTLNETQHTILELFLITEVLFKPKIFAVALIITLTPIIAVIMCVYFCCCKKTQKAKLPNKVLVSPQSISKCSECSICFQVFASGEQIAILPCSDMHIFHYTCIEGWTKVKANCPICRAQLSQS